MSFTEYKNNHLVYLDGGMGTLLQAKGLLPGESPERWNLSHPEQIQQIHRAYYEAGANVVNTNTFGANLLKFSEEELATILVAAVQNAKIARDTSRGGQEKYIALDIGPLGKLLKPYGELEFEDAVALFSKTVKIGAECGVDLVCVETMTDSYETKAALLAVKENCELPVIVTNAYGEDGKLLTGATPQAMTAMLEGMRADAIGVNCSYGPKEMKDVVNSLLCSSSVPVVMKPNAGIPRTENGNTVFDVNAEEFAEELAAYVEAGVRIVGGCCGTTPEYIRELVKRTQHIVPRPLTDKQICWVSSYTHSVVFGNQPILIGERINPTGKKRFKQALTENDMEYILQEGINQQEKGVHILDVNVGLPEIDETAMMLRAMRELQAVIDLPLQIDTTNYEAMEAALRSYNGKAMVNSVNGTKESMRHIFPLVQKYGGVVVALTLDDKGIPKTAAERVQIAEHIIRTAAEYGIQKKDLIFDSLTMTISTDPHAAKETLTATKRIREDLGCQTTLGVSNVSFGLPLRDAINSAFFTMALHSGLSAAIMNPYSVDMMKAYYSFCALDGIDENCAAYIDFAGTLPVSPSSTVSSVPDPKKTNRETAPIASIQKDGSCAPLDSRTEKRELLQKAIIKGRHQQAYNLTEELLLTVESLSIVNEDIIPALDEVGKGFEQGTMFLPQLLMSAEAAKHAFDAIKTQMTSHKTEGKVKYPIVIATVKGDIHDIGKNIVKLLLENYGYQVTDLGRSVEPELIVRTVLDTKAPLVALSALMTTTVPAMEETIRKLRAEAPGCKVIVGGAVMTQAYADKIGADKYGKDAMEAVRYAESLL